MRPLHASFRPREDLHNRAVRFRRGHRPIRGQSLPAKQRNVFSSELFELCLPARLRPISQRLRLHCSIHPAEILLTHSNRPSISSILLAVENICSRNHVRAGSLSIRECQIT